MSGKEYGNGFFCNGHLEEVLPGSKYADKEPIIVKHYLDDTVELGYFPDFNTANYGSKIIGGARKSKTRWNSSPMSDKIDILGQMGEKLESNGEYDILVAQTGGFPVKYVKKARLGLAQYLKRADEMVEPNPGRGPMVAATSVTTPHVQKWAILEGLFGNTSVTLKGDSTEPFSGYELANLVGEFKPMPPIQFITYRSGDARKAGFASNLYNELCVVDGGEFMLMGTPDTARKIGYGEYWDKIPGFPSNMFSFVSHGGAMIVDKSANIDLAVKNTLESFEFPKACKVPTVLLVHEDVYETYRDKLTEKVKALKVGDVTDEDTDVAIVSEDYWNRQVYPFLGSAKSGAKILSGGELNEPTVMEGYFADSTILEPGYPVYCIEAYSDLNSAVDKINIMAKESPKGKILDLSVQYGEDEFFNYLKSLRWGGKLNVFSMHPNLPTFTLGAAHESVEPRKVIAEGNFFDA